MSKLNHFSHEHPLVLSEENSKHHYNCSACGSRVVGLTYCCEECRYVLHKWCADLPRELTHHQLHPDHPLLLQFPKQDSEKEDSSPSSEDSVEAEYHSFDGDDEDAFQEGISVCKSCKDPIERDFIYRCEQCSFNLHADCASLPSQIMLQTDSALDPVGSKVYLSFEHINKYIPSKQIDGVWQIPAIYCCSYCSESGDGSRFLFVLEYPGNEPELISCGLHIQCAMKPKTVKHERHLHELTLHPPIAKDLDYDECYCDACEQERDPTKWIYYCESCEFAAHLGCGIAGLERPKQLILSAHPVYVEPKEEWKPEFEERHSKYIADLTREKERRKERLLEDGKGLKELKHFDHEHSLILYDEEGNEQVECHACEQPIFGNTYICNACKFYLHEWCAELPQEIHHRLHPEHRLTIVPSGDYLCEYCHTISSELYTFCCEKCDFGLHTVCAMLPESSIRHESHEHPLTPVLSVGYKVDTYSARCNACRNPCAGPMLRCELCSFNLHLVCALYPPTGKAKTHRHSLALTYSFQEDPNALEFICDACEKPRTPNRWLYSCLDAKCNFVAHVDCVAPKPFNNLTRLGDDNYKARFSV